MINNIFTNFIFLIINEEISKKVVSEKKIPKKVFKKKKTSKKESNHLNNLKAFIYGRKAGISVVFLSQTYVDLDMKIRKNTTAVIFHKLQSSDIPVIKRDLDITNEIIKTKNKTRKYR